MLKAKVFDNERVIAIVGVIVCCGLLMMAVPRFIASLYALYPESALKQSQEKLALEVYEKSIVHLSQALAWYENPEYRQELASFYLVLLNSSGSLTFEKKQELLKLAQTSIIKGLTLSPVDPYSWFRLAAVDKMLMEPSESIINALRLSFYAGRVEPAFLMQRLSLSYDYYGEFNEEMRQLWKKQIPVAQAFQPAKLVEFVALHPEVKRLAEEAFAYSPDDWKKFSNDLEIYLQTNH